MKKWRHSLRSAVVAITVAYALLIQAFLTGIVVTEAVAAGDVNIICLGGAPGTPGHGGKLPVGNGSCVLCSLSACGAGAGAALPDLAATFGLPQFVEVRIAPAMLAAQDLPQPHRTPKLSQAPPKAV